MRADGCAQLGGSRRPQVAHDGAEVPYDAVGARPPGQRDTEAHPAQRRDVLVPRVSDVAVRNDHGATHATAASVLGHAVQVGPARRVDDAAAQRLVFASQLLVSPRNSLRVTPVTCSKSWS